MRDYVRVGVKVGGVQAGCNTGMAWAQAGRRGSWCRNMLARSGCACPMNKTQAQPTPHLLSRHGGAQHVGQHCGQTGGSGCAENPSMQVAANPFPATRTAPPPRTPALPPMPSAPQPPLIKPPTPLTGGQLARKLRALGHLDPQIDAGACTWSVGGWAGGRVEASGRLAHEGAASWLACMRQGCQPQHTSVTNRISCHHPPTSHPSHSHRMVSRSGQPGWACIAASWPTNEKKPNCGEGRMV